MNKSTCSDLLIQSDVIVEQSSVIADLLSYLKQKRTLLSLKSPYLLLQYFVLLLKSPDLLLLMFLLKSN